MGLLATLGLPPLKNKSPDGPDLEAVLGTANDKKDPASATVGSTASGGGTTPPSGGTPPAKPASGPTAGAPTGSATGAADPEAKAFAVARAAVKRDIDALGKHPQQSRIVAEIAAASAKLGEADTQAAAKAWTQAKQALAEAKTLAATAKKAGDDWVDYLRQRADAEALAYAFGNADFDADAWVRPKLVAADNIAKGPPLNFAAALAKIALIPGQLKPLLKDLLDKCKAKQTAIDATSKESRGYAKAQVDPGRQHLAAADKHFAAGEWSACLQRAAAALRLLGPAARICERRDKYEAQRGKTVAAVATVRAQLPLKARAEALDKRVVQADALAAIGSLKIEQGLAELVRAEQQATTWAAVGPTIAEHAKERAAADRELAELDKHPAAAKVTAQREAIRTRLAGAKNLTVVIDGAPDPAAGWAGVLAEVKRARADLAAAKSLVDGLGAAAAAEAAAAKPGNKAALKTALDQLAADGAAAQGAKHADAAKEAFKRFDDAVKAAKEALAKNDGEAAAKATAQAAAALTEAKRIQTAHAQFAADLPALEARLKALQASPRAAQIKPRIDAVAKGLADAKAADAKHDGVEAIAALRRGSDAVAEAQAADKAREAFDRRATELAPRITALTDAGEKNALTGLETQAKAKADALDFAAAAKQQDQIELRLDKSAMKGLMSAGAPDAAKITTLAKKMVGQGGASEVDQMIQAIPNGGDIKLLNALAEGRYGVKFTNAAPFPAKAATVTAPAVPAGDPVKTMKVVCDMFSKIPQDIVDSPSVSGVEWKDAVGSAGGSHSYDDVKIRMNGRPGIPQGFGAAIASELPPDVEADCQPKNAAAVEYLGFAAAHEVGHAVDDAQGFMARNGHLEKYGGWTTFGASVQPIADAIGGDARFAAFYKTAEQKRYIADRLLNKPVQPPAAKPGDEANALAAFHNWLATATASDVYRRQGDCSTLQIGDYVYHEAYARVWVRYLASARKKALTGYQFRAPGEWFAELYAGYRSNKLKDSHPAMDWLKKL
ncbi:MAG: hypothetical protein KIT35_05235 [Piscinibacter sp.]|uniref:hypothetical protein n=1 Tax=Piscinibacter TaxID=1114981 RepID=UPI000FDEDF67|nr:MULTISPECIES: hypothetical protein [Piscinibacter]MCW5663214.1 hypothetical protein [Piscinibacter sp.]